MLVSAASSGLGRAIALEFAREGARVAICGRRQAALEDAAAEIAQVGRHRPIPIVADITTLEGCERFVHTAISALGGIDTLVVNSGPPPHATFEGLDDVAWQRAVDLFLFPSFRLSRLVAPELRKSKGSMVLLTSAAVREPGAFHDWVGSVAVRPGVHGLVKALAKELGPAGVRVNAVMPGTFATDRVIEEDGDMYIAPIPLGRYGRPEELAAVVVFLASERAGFVNGASVVVDGGEIRSIL